MVVIVFYNKSLLCGFKFCNALKVTAMVTKYSWHIPARALHRLHKL